MRSDYPAATLASLKKSAGIARRSRHTIELDLAAGWQRGEAVLDLLDDAGPGRLGQRGISGLARWIRIRHPSCGEWPFHRVLPPPVVPQ